MCISIMMIFVGQHKKWDELFLYGFFFISLFFLISLILAPKILRPFNQAWLSLGESLGRIINPMVLGVIFFILITPISILLKLLGRDVLSLKKSSSLNSYWKIYTSSNHFDNTFKNQF